MVCARSASVPVQIIAPIDAVVVICSRTIRSFLVLVIAVLIDLGTTTGQGTGLAADALPRSTEQTTERFPKILERLPSVSYPDFREAWAREMEISKSEDMDRSREAKQSLLEFEEKAREWLVSVGNERGSLSDFKKMTNACVNASGPLQPRHFGYLFGLSELGLLFLSGQSIRDEHLLVLSRFESLKGIDSWDTGIEGKLLGKLHLPNLDLLRLEKCPLTDEALSDMDFPKLMVLSVRDTEISNIALERLKMVGLKSLRLDGTKVDAAGLKSLGRFKDLQVLGVDANVLASDLAVSVINEKTSIRSVILRATKDQKQLVDGIRARIRKDCTVDARVIGE